MVVSDGLRLKITPDSGWYCVERLDTKGLVTQGRTIEEAIYMAAQKTFKAKMPRE